MGTLHVLETKGDTFRPRKPAATKESEVAVAAAIEVFGQIEAWASARRQVTEANAVPPRPEVMTKALEMLAIAKDQPR